MAKPPIDLKSLVVPDITDLALYFADDAIGNGRGDPIHVAAQIDEYQAALRDLVARLRAGTLARYRFEVPDFWHVAKGRAASLTAEDADRLLAAVHLGYALGEQFLVRHYAYGAEPRPNRIQAAVFLSRDAI